jgi:hypothetical protein
MADIGITNSVIDSYRSLVTGDSERSIRPRSQINGIISKAIRNHDDYQELERLVERVPMKTHLWDNDTDLGVYRLVIVHRNRNRSGYAVVALQTAVEDDR